MTTIFSTKIIKSRQKLELQINKLRLVAVFAAKVLDLYSARANGRRVFQNSPVEAIGNAWDNLHQSLQTLGIEESTYTGTGVAAGDLSGVSGGAVANFNKFDVVVDGHVFIGVESAERPDRPSRFVARYYKLQGLNQFQNLSKSTAMTRFASMFASYEVGHFALVDKSNMKVIQWWRDGVLFAPETVDTYLGDAVLHPEGVLDGGFVVDAESVTPLMLEHLQVAYGRANGYDGGVWLLTPLQVTETTFNANVRYYVKRSPVGQNADAETVNPLLLAPASEFFETQEAAIEWVNSIEPESFTDGVNTNLTKPWHASSWAILPRKFTYVDYPDSRDVDAVVTPMSGYAVVAPVRLLDNRDAFEYPAVTLENATVFRAFISDTTSEETALSFFNTNYQSFDFALCALVELPSMRVVRKAVLNVVQPVDTVNQFLQATRYVHLLASPSIGCFANFDVLSEDDLWQFEATDNQSASALGRVWRVETISQLNFSPIEITITKDKYRFVNFNLGYTYRLEVPALGSSDLPFETLELAVAAGSAGGALDYSLVDWNNPPTDMEQHYYFASKLSFNYSYGYSL